MAEGDPVVTQEGVDTLDKYTDSLIALRREQQLANEELRKARQNYGDTSAEAKKAQEQVERLSDQETYLTQSLSAVERQIISAKAAMKSFGQQSALTTNETDALTQSVSVFGQKLMGTVAVVAALGSNITRALINPLTGTKAIIDTLPAPLKRYNDIMHAHREILDLVNTSYAGFGRSMAESRVRGRNLVQEIGTISAKFGFSRDAVMKFVESGKSLPTIMDAIGKGAATAGVGATQLENVLLALRGAGMDVSKSGQLMMDLYARFGTRTAPEAAQQILTFAQAAKTTGINIEFVQKHLVAASSPLAVFGQKADVAARTWTTFTDALKNTLPIEEIGKLVNTVTGQIAKMDFQTRAFVAQMSGMAQGVSALGGALRMELDLRTAGGLERNLQRVTRMIARFGGGRITTLEEAVRNPGQEMQFQLQRQLVGRTLGVQGGQEQARVLEVLQRVQRGGMSNLEAQREMSKLTQSGRDVQKASLTALERMATTMTQSHNVLETLKGVEEKMAGDIEAVARVMTRGARANQPLTREEGRVIGSHLKSAAEKAMREATPAMGRLMSRIREGGLGIIGTLTGRQARQQPLERVLPETPGERFLAERIHPAIETVLRRPDPRDRDQMPMEPMPFMGPTRRAEPPAAFPAPPLPAGGPLAPGVPTVGAPGAGTATRAGREPMNVTLRVTCDKCQEELMRKNLDELEDRRDQHNLGIETGRYAR